MASNADPSLRQRRSEAMLPTAHQSGRTFSPSAQIQTGPHLDTGSLNLTDFTIRIPGSDIKRQSSTKRHGDGSGTRADVSDVTDRDGSDGPRASASRWQTLEFRIYAVIFVLVVPMMVYWPMRLSSGRHHNYPFYAYRLSPGWLFGRQVDNSDAQYSSFRNNIPGLLFLGSLFLLASHIHRRLTTSPSSRSRFLLVSSTIVLFILHGLSAPKILLILLANYHLAKVPKSGIIAKAWPGLVIAGNMLVLLMNERWAGYPYAEIHPALEVMDTWDGLLPGWHNHFKITMLRIVSFACDHHWRTGSVIVEPPTDHRSRVNRSLHRDEYSLVNFIAYAIYPPLYIAGPIMTFNDFTWQIHHPVHISTRDRISYAIRFVFCFLTMESLLHTMYVVAIKDTHAWDGDSPADLSMIGFWNLVVVWLKLLIPWRFFRLWAILDNVDPPENMVRCVANNYSTLGFWRSWHRSYNLWVVRYIYIPVGGGKNVALATLLVFTFVALWHDLSFKLLAWGWLVSLFILPELLARRVVSFDKYGHEWWFRHVAAVGGVMNILLMMSANLVGFVLGVDGMKYLVFELASTVRGWTFTAFSCACLFVAVQVMFEYRAEEARRGVDRRC